MLDSIIPYLYDIAITLGIISICYTLWIQGKYYGENLTMEEKPITIILENYNKEKITFTMSGDARVETFLEINGSRVVGVNIQASDEDIEIEKEEFTGLNQ